MTKKRSIAFVLALLMCLTLLPAGVLAADDPVEVETPGGEVENTVTWTDSTTKISYAADGGIATVTGYTGTGTKLTIPDTVTHSSVTYKVTTIGYEGLKGLSINELVLGANITALRGGAVADCFSLTKVTVTRTGCIGICQFEPVVEVFEAGKDKVTYVKMTPEKAKEVVEKHLKGGKVITDYVVKDI